MANQIQQLTYEYGVVQSVSSQDMQATLLTPTGRLIAMIPKGGVVTTIPAVGESWTFYRNGNTVVLNARYSPSPTSDETHMFPGDSLVSVSGAMHIRTSSFDASDQFGELFNPITGEMSPSRECSTRVYAVRSESDSQSIDGHDVIAPCVIIVFSEDGSSSMKWRSE